MDRDDPEWPPGWLVVLAVIVVAGGALTVLAGLVLPLLRGLADLLAAGAGSGFEWADGPDLARMVLDPVRSYLDSHAVELPVSSDTLWWAWAGFGLAAFVLSVPGSVGARIGWALFGVVTAGMVWSETSRPAAWVAVGVTAVWWSLFSVLAFRRRRRLVPPPNLFPPPQAPAVEAAAEAINVVEPRDQVAEVAAVYELLLRRRRACDLVLARSGPAWTVVAGENRGFAATDGTGALVTGSAVTAEAVLELLAGISDSPGATPEVRWMTPPPRAPERLALDWRDYHPGLPGVAEYVRSTPEQLHQVCAALRTRRDEWNPGELAEQIAARAAALNETHPLIQPHRYVPETRALFLGELTRNDWVDPVTIVQATRGRWNDFGEHRPEIVGLIINKILTADDLETAVEEILSDDGHVHLDRFDGPAGPIHEITVNGGHRTHAFRILGAPLIAAQVRTQPVPLRLTSIDVWVPGFTVSAERLWRGLIHHGLLVADIIPTASGPVLEPHHVLAPWLLLDPATCVQISAAYDRVYPGALADAGIPASARRSAATWQRWLTAGAAGH